jgi:hypothetical protein
MLKFYPSVQKNWPIYVTRLKTSDLRGKAIVITIFSRSSCKLGQNNVAENGEATVYHILMTIFS